MDNATEVMYSDGTMAFVTLNSSGQYHVNITALNCAGSSPALSAVINIIDTGILASRKTLHVVDDCYYNACQRAWTSTDQ